MLILIRLFLILELPLLCTEKLFPVAHVVLPLGGDHLTQLGILLILAVFLGELLEIFKRKPTDDEDEGGAG